MDIASRVESIREKLQQNIGGEPAILFSRSGCPILIEALSGAYRYRTTLDATRVTGAKPVKDMYSNPVDALGYALARLAPAGQFTKAFGLNVKPKVNSNFTLFSGRST